MVKEKSLLNQTVEDGTSSPKASSGTMLLKLTESFIKKI